MKEKIIACCVLLLMAAGAFAAPPGGRSQQRSTAALDTEKWIDANQILMFVTNQGGFANQATNTFGKSDGLYFPFTDIESIQNTTNDNTVIFAAGIWVGGVDTAAGDTITVVAEFSNDYTPGPMQGGTFIPGSDTDPQYRVFKLTSDMTAADQEWQDYMSLAVPDGAPTRLDTAGNPMPDIIGDQFLWSVYNDADPSRKVNKSSSSEPLGVEIRQSTFAFDREDALGKVVFLRFQVFNKGTKNLDDVFISLWADPDLGGSSDDLVGCDTVLSMGYCYNATNADNDYGSTPPAVGFDFFQGPLDTTGATMADTAKMWGQKFPGLKNMGMTSFNKYINGTDPQNFRWVYQYMNGLDASLGGAVLTNPSTGQSTKFFGSGDPVKGTGWIDANESDRRWMQTTGPISFAIGDSTEIVAAVVVGRGPDRLSSITAMKFWDQSAQKAFDDDFVVPAPPATPIVTGHALDGRIALEWTDTSYADPGDYDFEGYTIFQGESPSGPWTRLDNYDLVNNVLVVQELDFDQNAGVAVVRPTKFGTDAGVRMFFSTNEDALNGGTLSNFTPYFFRVEAYSFTEIFDPDTGLKTGERSLTSASNVTVIPQGPVAGDVLPVSYGEELMVSHPFGISQGTIIAMAVGPDSLTGHQYEVTFVEDTAFALTIDTTCVYTDSVGPDTCDATWDPLGDSLIVVLCDHECDSILVDTTNPGTIRTFWNLRDLTTNQLKLTRQFNLSGDNNYAIVDGIFVLVGDPPPPFASFQLVANASGTLSPPEAAALNFQGFPTPGDANPASGGHWAVHTGDSQPEGTRASYLAFQGRVFRVENDSGGFLGEHDLEWRFTGSNDDPMVGGGYAWEPYENNAAIWVPFELWDVGIGTPDDPSDDVRMIPHILDNTRSGTFDLESYGDATFAPPGFVEGDPATEHTGSGGFNDPFTDWISWYMPVNNTPGDAGYQEFEDSMLTDPVSYSGPEIEWLANTVLVSWNGHTTFTDTTIDTLVDTTVTPPDTTIDTAITHPLTDPPVFDEDLPAIGSVFRIVTTKPNHPADVFQFTAPAPARAVAGDEGVLDKVKAVPNPYYLASSYDNSVVERRMKFTNLPSDAVIKIFTLAGTFVTSIERDNPTRAFEEWNLENEFGIPVASGIYLYVVESAAYGTKIGKMAIFTEEEQLNTF